jgi:hypothetical protein
LSKRIAAKGLGQKLVGLHPFTPRKKSPSVFPKTAPSPVRHDKISDATSTRVQNCRRVGASLKMPITSANATTSTTRATGWLTLRTVVPSMPVRNIRIGRVAAHQRLCYAIGCDRRRTCERRRRHRGDLRYLRIDARAGYATGRPHACALASAHLPRLRRPAERSHALGGKPSSPLDGLAGSIGIRSGKDGFDDVALRVRVSVHVSPTLRCHCRLTVSYRCRSAGFFLSWFRKRRYRAISEHPVDKTCR